VPGTSLKDEILALKRERDAIILVHNYQLPEVQDIADSLRRFARTLAGCRHHGRRSDRLLRGGFHAETAAILSPDKTVLLPAPDACCPMAQMISAEELPVCQDTQPGRGRGLLREYNRRRQGQRAISAAHHQMP